MQVRGGCCFKFQEVFIPVTVTAQPFLCHRSLRYLPTLQRQAVQTGYFGTLPEELPPAQEAAVPTYMQCLGLPGEMKPTSFVMGPPWAGKAGAAILQQQDHWSSSASTGGRAGTEDQCRGEKSASTDFALSEVGKKGQSLHGDGGATGVGPNCLEATVFEKYFLLMLCREEGKLLWNHGTGQRQPSELLSRDHSGKKNSCK